VDLKQRNASRTDQQLNVRISFDRIEKKFFSVVFGFSSRVSVQNEEFASNSCSDRAIRLSLSQKLPRLIRWFVTQSFSKGEF
jgi:hypothetical protein